LKAVLALLTVFILASVMQAAQIDGLIKETREVAEEFYGLREEYEEIGRACPGYTQNAG
jgi:hypothetical protein